MSVSFGRLKFGVAGVLVIYCLALLASIKDKMITSFELVRFGPTEFKALLALYGVAMALLVLLRDPQVGWGPKPVARTLYCALLAAGLIQLLFNLIRSIHQVNLHGVAPDTSEWELAAKSSDK